MTAPPRALVKLCGLRTAADVDAAVAAGADAIGLVLCASPRRVVRAEAARLLARVPPGVLRVAVLGAPTAAGVALANALPFDALQCELGQAPPPVLAGARFLLPSFRDGAEVEARVARVGPLGRGRHPLHGAFVLDGPRGGGRGTAPEPARAARLAATGRMVLAGGLTPDSVAAAVTSLRPLAVDVSSGVERARGRKDPALLRAFVAAARAALPVPDSSDPRQELPA